MATLTRDGDRWLLRSSYEEREIPKAARFRWDPQARVWWTSDRENAAKLARYADGSCAADLSSAATEKRAVLAASRAVEAPVDLIIPCPDGLAFLPFQRAGVAYATARERVLIADEMGLGKTIQAIGVANAAGLRSVLVICPASLRLNWAREWAKWSTASPSSTIYVVEGGKAQPAIETANVVVVNYDIVGKHHAAFMARAWDLVVIDESHYLKSEKAQRTKLVYGAYDRQGVRTSDGLVHRAKRVLCLTGTPLLNRPIELWSTLQALDPSGLGRSFFGFAKRYASAHQGPHGWDFSGASNLGELQERMRAAVMVRRLKADVLTELPAKRRQIVELPRNGEAAAVEAERDALSLLDEMEGASADAAIAEESGDAEAYKSAVARLAEASKVAFESMSAVRAATAVAKAPRVVDYARDILDGSDSKLVIMAHHHAAIDILADGLREYGVVTLDGRESDPAKRQQAVDRFQTDPSVRVFIGGIHAAGVGITLTASATVLFAELDWVPGWVTQAEDRCHRIGQRDQVHVIHLVLEGSIDARIARMIVAKQDVADATLDDVTPGEGGFDALLDLVDARAEKGAAKRAKRNELVERLAPADVAAAHDAMRRLAGVCDGAVERDDSGFSRYDAALGHRLASLDTLTPGQALLALRLARTYRRQLGTEHPAVVAANSLLMAAQRQRS